MSLNFAVSHFIDFHDFVVLAAPVENAQKDDAKECTEEQNRLYGQPCVEVSIFEGRDVVSDDEEGQATTSLKQEAELFYPVDMASSLPFSQVVEGFQDSVSFGNDDVEILLAHIR